MYPLNERSVFKTLGTTIINSLMSLLSLCLSTTNTFIAQHLSKSANFECLLTKTISQYLQASGKAIINEICIVLKSLDVI